MPHPPYPAVNGQGAIVTDEVRLIEAGALAKRFARGWHCLGLAEAFADGRPHPVAAFGTKLVVWQGADGRLRTLDAYCRHMGGDLSQGEVVGDVVACPFHSWRWGGDGRCQEIPYARRVPPRARTRAWPTLVQDGQLFVWHDPEGNQPDPEVAIPRIEGWDEEQWTPWVWKSTLVPSSPCRDIVDNMVDMAHFYYVHKGLPTYFKNVFEGPRCTQHYAGTSWEAAATGLPIEVGEYDGQIVRSEATYHGPAYLEDKLWNTYGDITVESLLITSHYPITETSFVLQYGIVVKKHPAMSDQQNARMAEIAMRTIEPGFLQDVEIWKNKTRIANPLLCDEDGPVYQLRRWYEQFYVDVADIRPEMVQRFEFEIDTAKAVEAWQAELVGSMS
jgi:phenylpropionate dioxygenase-like ring-hydroxylating dioxygenase large terminal subunit